jgi:hypothetical protein
MRWFASGFGLVSANSRFIIHDGPIRGGILNFNMVLGVSTPS